MVRSADIVITRTETARFAIRLAELCAFSLLEKHENLTPPRGISALTQYRFINFRRGFAM